MPRRNLLSISPASTALPSGFRQRRHRWLWGHHGGVGRRHKQIVGGPSFGSRGLHPHSFGWWHPREWGGRGPLPRLLSAVCFLVLRISAWLRSRRCRYAKDDARGGLFLLDSTKALALVASRVDP